MALQRWTKTASPVPGTTVGSYSYGYSYTFPTIGIGSVGLVSVSVPNSAPGTQWLVSIGGQQINSVYGAASMGPYWVQGGDVITIQSGPISIFSASPGNAVAVGVIGNQGELSPTGLQSGGGVPVGNNLIGDLAGFPLSPFNAGTITPSLNFSLNARGILVSADSPPIVPPGSAGQYLPVDNAALKGQYGGSATEGTWYLPTFGITSIQVAFAGTPTYYLVAEIDYDFDFYEVARGLGVYSVAVPNPATGTNWNYTLTAPARIVAIQAILETSSTVANRFPFIQTSLFDSYAITAAAVAASTTLGLNGYRGGPTTPVLAPGPNSAGSNLLNFYVPDWGLLPAGASIGSNIGNMDAGDRWINIALQLLPI